MGLGLLAAACVVGVGPPSPAHACNTVDLATHPGLYPDGTHDVANELILQDVFNRTQPCDTIVFPRGAVYAHSADLVLDTPNVTLTAGGTGPDPELLSTNVMPAGGQTCVDGYPGPCMALTLAGNGDRVSGLLIANAHTPTRSTYPSSSGIVLSGDGQSVSDTTLFRSDMNGIRVLGATHLGMSNLTFDRTGGASLLFHPGANGAAGWALVSGVTINDPGDDGIAIESYVGGPQQHNIWVDRATYHHSGSTSTAGHAFAVVGGTNIAFTNFSASGSPSASIYVASGQVFANSGSSNVKFLTGTITNANTWASSPRNLDNGAVLIWSDSKGASQIDGIDLEAIQITDTNLDASYQVGDLTEPTTPASPPPTNVTFKDFTFRGGPPRYLNRSNTPPATFSTINWQVKDPDGTTMTFPDHPTGPPPP